MKKLFIFAICILSIFLPACNKNTTNPSPTENGQRQDDSSSENAPSKNEISKEVNYQFKLPEKGEQIGIIKTSFGDIKIRFFPQESPKAVENFIEHSKNKYYDGLLFHRVINNFMIQTGDPLGNGTGGESIWGKAFEDELSDKLHYFRGALAMANSGPNTNKSQFFIVQNATADSYDQMMTYNKFSEELLNQYKLKGGTPHLEPGFFDPSNGFSSTGYSIFGQVIDGIDTIDKIAAVEVGANDKPTTDVKILSIEIITAQ